jgi:glycosyltransferase involved in cell wall biosynthesis
VSRLRFCMVTTFYPPHNFGGDGIDIQRLSRALVRRGHEVVVVHDVDAYAAVAGESVPPLAQGTGTDGVTVVPLRSRLPVLSALLRQQTGRPVVHAGRLRALLEGGRFDVIHYHNVSLVGGPGVLSMGDALKLYTAHEHWLVCPTHVLWRHGREPCAGRECLRCTLHYRRPPQLWRDTRWMRRQLDQVDAFIARSEFSRQKHREFGFDHDMDVIPAFLPDPPTGGSAGGETGSAAVARDRPYFLFVGRLERMKGLDDVLPLFRGTPAADLLVIGDGTHAGSLRRQAEGSPAVRFLGAVPPEQLRAHYRDALAVIAPSTGWETFGLVLIEAFRERTPILARRRGPYPEMVELSGGGMLFDTADELAEAMRRIRTEPRLRDRLGQAGQQAFGRYWTETVVLDRYLDLVRRTAQGRGRTRIVDALSSPTVAAGARAGAETFT